MEKTVRCIYVMARSRPNVHPLWGRASLRDAVSKGECSPLITRSRINFLRDHEGQGAIDAVTNRLSPEALECFQGRTKSHAWFPCGLYLEIDKHLLSMVFDDRIEGFYQLARWSAERDLGGILKPLLWLAGNPRMVATRMIAGFSKYYRNSRGSIEILTERSANFYLYDFVPPFHFCEHMVTGWTSKAMELAGGTGIHVVQTECVHWGDPNCGWHIEWDDKGSKLRR